MGNEPQNNPQKKALTKLVLVDAFTTTYKVKTHSQNALLQCKKKSGTPIIRSHSVQGISKAKIKTVKLTVVVIVGYIVCSAPFICVQLWAALGSPPQDVCKHKIMILFVTLEFKLKD